MFAGSLGCSGPEAPPPERTDQLGILNVLNTYSYLALPNDEATTFHLGDGFASAALPCVGDFDGDGFDSLALYDSKESRFYLQNENRPDAAVQVIAFGKPSTFSLCGDFDGDGIDTIGFYDPATGEFQLRNENSEGPADRIFTFGVAGGYPIAGDFDGDGTDTVGIFDSKTATFQLEGVGDFTFGHPNDFALAGDFDGDGTDTIGVFDPLTGKFELRNENTAGDPDEVALLPIIDRGVVGVGPIHFPLAGHWRDSGARAEQDGFAWPASTPADENIDSVALDAVYAKARALPRLHSLLVVRHGKLVKEEYFHGMHRGMSNNIQSCSKSMLALLYGIAYEQGLYTAGTPVQQILPRLGTDPAKQKILIEHLLTMSSGLGWSEVYPLNTWAAAPDPLLYVWDQPVTAAPGSTFLYSTGTSYVAGAALQEIVGERIDQFARRELFEPAGVSLHNWVRLAGVPQGGSAMHLLPRDMARIGELVLRRGALDGKQIVSSAWIDFATTPLISAASDSPYDFYGAKFWVIDVNGTRIISARGLGGQFIFIIPVLDTVIVTTSVWYTNGAAADQSYTDALSLILRDVLPTIRP